MSKPFLSAEIYFDDASPNVSAEPALAGIDIVRTIAPWIRVSREYSPSRLDKRQDNMLNVDEAEWPQSTADVTLVLTERELTDNDMPGKQQSQSTGLDYLGWTFTWYKPRLRHLAIINTKLIKRPEHIVAHEVGHIFGVRDTESSMHCQDKRCLMYPTQFPYGKADRSFCDCCSEQLYDNSLKLRNAKAGRLAVGRIAGIF